MTSQICGEVDSLLAELQTSPEQGKLRVNAVGLSRGGIACSYLAQEICLILFVKMEWSSFEVERFILINWPSQDRFLYIFF